MPRKPAEPMARWSSRGSRRRRDFRRSACRRRVKSCQTRSAWAFRGPSHPRGWHPRRRPRCAAHSRPGRDVVPVFGKIPQRSLRGRGAVGVPDFQRKSARAQDCLRRAQALRDAAPHEARRAGGIKRAARDVPIRRVAQLHEDAWIHGFQIHQRLIRERRGRAESKMGNEKNRRSPPAATSSFTRLFPSPRTDGKCGGVFQN